MRGEKIEQDRCRGGARDGRGRYRSTELGATKITNKNMNKGWRSKTSERGMWRDKEGGNGGENQTTVRGDEGDHNKEEI